MTRLAARIASSLVVPLALCALAQPALAATKDVHEACQKHVKMKFKQDHPMAHEITLTETREWQESTTLAGIGGTADVVGTDKKTKTFEWTCVYNTTLNKVEHIDLGKESKAEPAAK
jgi:hypothetical protein